MALDFDIELEGCTPIEAEQSQKSAEDFLVLLVLVEAEVNHLCKLACEEELFIMAASITAHSMRLSDAEENVLSCISYPGYHAPLPLALENSIAKNLSILRQTFKCLSSDKETTMPPIMKKHIAAAMKNISAAMIEFEKGKEQ